MSFELFITFYQQVLLMTKGIFPYFNLKFKNNYEINMLSGVKYFDSKSKLSISKILQK